MRGKLEGVARIACQNANFVPNIVFTSHRTDSILDMVTNQACVALLMDVHVQLPENGPRPSYSPGVPFPSHQRSLHSCPCATAATDLFPEQPSCLWISVMINCLKNKITAPQKAWHTITVCSLQRGCFHKARS